MPFKLSLCILFLLTPFYNGYAQNAQLQPDDRGYVVTLGQEAPDFVVDYADGQKPKNLSDFRGSVVMLQFTASWCGVCIKEMPHIEERIWKAYKDRGMVLLGVDRKEPRETVQKFAKRMKITYPLIMDEKSQVFSLYAHPDAGVTRNVLIDKSGKIVFMTRLFDEQEFDALVQKISEIL